MKLNELEIGKYYIVTGIHTPFMHYFPTGLIVKCVEKRSTVGRWICKTIDNQMVMGTDDNLKDSQIMIPADLMPAGDDFTNSGLAEFLLKKDYG